MSLTHLWQAKPTIYTAAALIAHNRRDLRQRRRLPGNSEENQQETLYKWPQLTDEVVGLAQVVVPNCDLQRLFGQL